MKLTSPYDVVMAKKPFAYSGNRLNGLFLSEVMGDNDTVRKLIHEQRYTEVPILTALYSYYKNRDKQQLFAEIKRIENEAGAECPFFVLENKNGEKILKDWSCYGTDGEESFWADLSQYDIKYDIVIEDMFGQPRRSKHFKNVTVAEVLDDAINNRNAYLDKCPQTGNAELDVLISNLYQDNKNNPNKPLHEATYFKALQKINADLLRSFKQEKMVDDKTYIPAVVMLDNISVGIFDEMGYRELFGFYRSELGQEMLKFSYLTTFIKQKKFDEKDMVKYLEKVKNNDLWQVAQYHITNELVKNEANGSVLNHRLLGFNDIPERPKEKLYQKYYDADVERKRYLNWYLPQAKRR